MDEQMNNGFSGRAVSQWGEMLQNQRQSAGEPADMRAYREMKEIVGRKELEELKNSSRAQDAIASAFAIAREQKDGRVPQVLTDYLNRQFGFDGKTAGIVEGGIDPKTGEFGFVFGERDDAGNTAYRKQTIPISTQLGLMEGYPSLFSADAVAAHRQKMMDSGLSSGEVESYSKVARLARERLANRMDELTTGGTRRGTTGRQMFAQSGGGNSLKDVIGALTQMQGYLRDNGATLPKDQRMQLEQAVSAGFGRIAAMFAPQAAANPEGGSGQNGPQVSEDGSMMKLMDGRTVRKDQEFDVAGPNGEKMKFIWRGGEARNVEKID